MWISRASGRSLGGLALALALVALIATAVATAATPNKVELVMDINGTSADSIDPAPAPDPPGISDFAAAGSAFYFVADDGNGKEVWKSDGTANGTFKLKDINAGGGSQPQWLTAVGSTLYFSADDGSGARLWTSDGTSAGTVPVANSGSAPSGLAEVNGTLFYAAGSADGVELWRLAGASATQVKDINGAGNSSPANLTNFNGTLAFTAVDSQGYELWTSNGTEGGTRRVKDIWDGPASSSAEHLTVAGDKIYFRAEDDDDGMELWVSDGTEGGTEKVIEDPNGVNLGNNPTQLKAAGNTLFFAGAIGTSQRELWKASGATATLVKDIEPGNGLPRELQDVGGMLFFQAFTTTGGTELWKSDGTEGGTSKVREINLGSGGSEPTSIVDIDGTAYFVANDGNGKELWRSNGTEAGTVPVGDIHPTGGSDPNYLTRVGDQLFFGANDGDHGFELWKAFDTTPPPAPTPVTPGGGSSAGASTADTVPPATNLPSLSLRLKGRAGKLPKKGMTVSAKCPLEACDAKLIAFVETKRKGKTKRAAVTGTVSKTLTAGKQTDIALKWTKAGYRKLQKETRGKRSATLLIEASATPTVGIPVNGGPSKQTAKIKVKLL